MTVRVVNRGSGAVAAPAVIQTEEGARHTFPVSAPVGETLEASYFVLTRPVQAAVDPDGELLQPDRGMVWQPVRLRQWWNTPLGAKTARSQRVPPQARSAEEGVPNGGPDPSRRSF